MKQNVLLVVVAAIIMVTPHALQAGTVQANPCDHVDTIMDRAGQAMSERATQVYASYVKRDDRSVLEKCLGSIGGGQIINLGIPNIEQLFDEACAMLRGEIDSHLSKTNQSQSVSVLDGMVTVGQSTGPGTQGKGVRDGVTVNDTSGRVRDNVWRSIQ